MKSVFSKKLSLLFVVSVLAIGLIVPPHSLAAGKAKAAKAAGFNVVFDMAHNEIFSPENDGKLHYSSFYKGFQEAGAKTSVNLRLVTPEVLKGIDAYVIAGPARDFITPEIGALQGFVHNGGSLLVLLHISSPVARLTESFGILVSNFVVSEEQNTIKGKSQDFVVKDIAPSPVTKGLKEIAVFGSWGLMTEGRAVTVARTSKKAWADLDRNRVHDKKEPTQAFGIIAVREFGAGRVVVVADDAPFANAFINVGDNAGLAQNIINWFKDKKVNK